MVAADHRHLACDLLSLFDFEFEVDFVFVLVVPNRNVQVLTSVWLTQVLHDRRFDEARLAAGFRQAFRKSSSESSLRSCIFHQLTVDGVVHVLQGVAVRLPDDRLPHEGVRRFGTHEGLGSLHLGDCIGLAETSEIRWVGYRHGRCQGLRVDHDLDELHPRKLLWNVVLVFGVRSLKSHPKCEASVAQANDIWPYPSEAPSRHKLRPLLLAHQKFHRSTSKDTSTK
mmetsp:Transcript_10581/g.23335  ORF Transcript_10581/g.23335 Transcript_10581/m.23335 type:complete len:226 (+) Transcript_10581:317-994(+)